MFVYVLNKDGKPLMPTKKLGKVRHMLKDGRVKVVQRTPFTIQLTYETTGFTQEISLGVDAGSKVVGLSATTEKEELFASEVVLRKDVTLLLADRRTLRRRRRSKNKRYRKCRFLNRKKPVGWIPPSFVQKINTHICAIRKVYNILPVSKLVVEVAPFNIPRFQNKINGKKAETKKGFHTIRDYILERDNYTCQNCGANGPDISLNVHHIESRRSGGNSPNNLITLCKRCHTNFHNGKIQLNFVRGVALRDAAFMNRMGRNLLVRLNENFQNIEITYGYNTKELRDKFNLRKSHRIDARCISGHPCAKEQEFWFLQKAVRRHNRQVYQVGNFKGGIRKKNQTPKFTFGFKRFDKVLLPNGLTGFITGRRMSGKFGIKNLKGEFIKTAIKYTKLRLLERGKTLLCEMERADEE